MASISSSAVDGLVSGLDTASIISQLLKVDAAPQTAMKSKVTAAESKVSAYQSVNTKLSALQTAAEALTKASTWTAAKATSSATNVTATAGATALPGSVNLYVDQLASARSVMTDEFPTDATGTSLPTIPGSTKTDAAAALGYPLDVVVGGKLVGTVKISSGSLEDVAAAINKASADLGVSAVALRVRDGVYRLQITSAKTGSAEGDFKLVPHVSDAAAAADPDAYKDALEDSTKFRTMTSAQDAIAYITPNLVSSTPSAADNPIEVRSSSNTFSDLMKGVTVTATDVGASKVSVATDATAVTAAVKGLVDAANAAIAQINSSTKSGTVSSSGTNVGSGALNGDATLRGLKSSIQRAVTDALGGTTSAAKFGVESKSDGSIVFTEATFTKAFAADPTTVQKMLAPTSVDAESPNVGIAERLLKVTKSMTDTDSGSITNLIKGQTSTISDLNKRISDWDSRLTAKKAYYQKYYANLEVALGKLQSQSTWLSGQLSSLSSSS